MTSRSDGHHVGGPACLRLTGPWAIIFQPIPMITFVSPSRRSSFLNDL